MKEQLYGYASGNVNYENLNCLKTQNIDGFFLIAPNIDEKHVKLSEWCNENNLDLILGFTDSSANPDEERLERALAVTKKLAIGTTSQQEWVGSHREARAYRRMGDKYGFEWVCSITHRNVLWDLKRGSRVRDTLGDTLCTCLCGYVLAGYLFDEPRMPHMNVTSLAGRNLHAKFGVTIENLTKYLSPMNILSGAGFQAGLDVGSRVYAKELGFKGLVIGAPFDLEGTDQIAIKPKPSAYPKRCEGN
jgi:hypothetical protein